MLKPAPPARARDPRPAIHESEGIEIPAERRMVRGGLLLYHFPTSYRWRNASTILEHVDGFKRHSRFGIRTVNTDQAFPPGLAELDFELVIVHYSLLGPGDYLITDDHLRWLETSRGHKVLFAQDEYRYCGHRFWFCRTAGIDTVYTHLRADDGERIYGERAGVRRVRTNIPGYVSDRLHKNARRFSIPDPERPIDVGYRGRPLQAYSGRGGLEKLEIGRRFGALAAESGLSLDIRMGEEDRIYGDDWYRYLGRCKAILGVESGVSIFDLDDEVVDEYERLTAEGREVTVDDLTRAAALEDRIFYRTIGPRHFEAAAMRTCQVLFEGSYSGVMEPMVHYVPLRKDFSNFDEVLARLTDPEVRRELTENSHRDLIGSGRYNYERFIADFDADLVEAGLDSEIPSEDAKLARRAMRGAWRRWARAQAQWWFHLVFAQSRFWGVYTTAHNLRAWVRMRLGRLFRTDP